MRGWLFLYMDKNELYKEQPVENDLPIKEGVIVEQSPLTLSIDDKDAVITINDWIQTSRSFFKEKYNLYERRKKNEIVLFGRQIEEKEKQRLLKVYEARYLDNVIYEIEAAIKPLAMSRLPDMIILPSAETKDAMDTAESITKVIDTDLKKRENRYVLGMAFKHHPTYFTGIIKCVWDAEINDYRFVNVHPDLIDIDHTAKTNDADKMKWISETMPISVQKVIMLFPDKKDEFLQQVQLDGIDVGDETNPKTKGLLTEVNIKQVWYDWYEKVEDKWAKTSCVMWKYKDVVLKNIRNPNFDYKGQEKIYIGEGEAKKEVDTQTMMQMAITGMAPEGLNKEQVYRNFFAYPRKPYFFIGYDQWGKIGYDETSRIEQNMRNQEILDRTGKSVIDKLSARVKHVFSKDGGLKKDDIENMDIGDPMQDLLVEGNVNDVHSVIEPDRPSAQEFQELNSTRQRMYQLAGANAIRGEVMSDTATSNQIAREGDFTRADDLVEDTINAAHEWMAQWTLHMIKLRYTEEHMRKISGQKGTVAFIRLHTDMIQDGMEVRIKSSGTDKLKTRQQAMELSAQKLIDPVRLFRDLGLDDPEGRTEDLMLFQTDPASYLAKVKGLGSTTPQLISTLMGSAQEPLIQSNGALPPLSPATTAPSVEGTTSNPSPVDTSSIPPTPTGPPQASPRSL